MRKVLPTSPESFLTSVYSNQQKQRDIIELLTRDDSEDDSGAISLSAIKDIASIGSSVASAIGSLFHSSNQQQRRELLEILARDDSYDETGAISLSAIKDIASIGSSVASAIGGLFHSNSQQSRELDEILARESDEDDEDDDESGAIMINGHTLPCVRGICAFRRESWDGELLERSLNELD